MGVVEAAGRRHEEPYPVQLTVRGHINDLCMFLTNLTENGYFLPLDRIVIQATGVEKFKKPGYGYRTNEEVEATMICSGFLVLQDLDKLRQKKGKEVKKSTKRPREGGE